MKRMTLKTKLVMFSLMIGIIPFAVISVMSLWKSSAALETGACNQLLSVREIKKAQIENFFDERQGDMGVLVEMVGTLREEAFSKLTAIRNNKKAAVELLLQQVMVDIAAQQDRSICTKGLAHYKTFLDTGDKSGEYDRYCAIIDGFVKTTGYYDYFVVDGHGVCVHSQAKEADYKTNLLTGPYKDSGLGRAVQRAMKGGMAFEDFAPYAPSNGEPAAFVAAPIMSSGKQAGVVALQMSLEKIQALIQERTGLGKTGEVYLVGRDKLMRTDSHLDPEHHTVKASFANPQKGSVDTEAVTSAMAGNSEADVIIDYNGNPVLSAWSPIDFLGVRWAIIAEIDVAEAFCPKDAKGVEFFKKYMDMYGYYDLFLFNPDGYCFYSVCREADYQTNLVNGKYAHSGLGRAVQACLETGQFTFGDFAPYAPSNGDPAAFIVQPVLHDRETELVVGLQLSLAAINGIMQQREGLGETGETYLVGPDKLMRSDSYLDKEGHSVKASFAGTVQENGVDTEASQLALAGEGGTAIILDYNGNSVLSAYTPVQVFDSRWAMLAEVDKAEVFASIDSLTWLIAIISAVAVSAIVLLALLVGSSIATPIRNVVESLSAGAQQTSAAAEQVSSSGQQMANGASEQAASLEETSASLEELSSSVKLNVNNARNADEVAQNAYNATEKCKESMDRMSLSIGKIKESSDETAKIIKTIDEIAFQTNLLALNAAVEAARAGEAGKGFAVVAEEVRNLAQRSADAAKSTAELIKVSQSNAGAGVDVSCEVSDSLNSIVENVKEASGLINSLSQATQEQSKGIVQINKAVTEMDQVTQSNAANAEESASASEELSAQAVEVKRVVDTLDRMVNGMNKAAVNI